MLPPENRFQHKQGAVARHLEKPAFGQLDLLGIVHDIDHLEAISIVKVVVLLPLQKKNVASNDWELVPIEPVNCRPADDDHEFVEVMRVLDLR